MAPRTLTGRQLRDERGQVAVLAGGERGECERCDAQALAQLRLQALAQDSILLPDIAYFFHAAAARDQ